MNCRKQAQAALRKPCTHTGTCRQTGSAAVIFTEEVMWPMLLLLESLPCCRQPHVPFSPEFTTLFWSCSLLWPAGRSSCPFQSTWKYIRHPFLTYMQGGHYFLQRIMTGRTLSWAHHNPCGFFAGLLLCLLWPGSHGSQRTITQFLTKARSWCSLFFRFLCSTCCIIWNCVCNIVCFCTVFLMNKEGKWI